jgi:hypothetical protein
MHSINIIVLLILILSQLTLSQQQEQHYSQQYTLHKYALLGSNENPIFSQLPLSNIQQVNEKYILCDTKLFTMSVDGTIVTRIDNTLSINVIPGTRIAVNKDLLYVVTPNGYYICKEGVQCVFHIMNFGKVSSVVMTNDQSLWVGSEKGVTFVEGSFAFIDRRISSKISAFVNESVTCLNWNEQLQTLVVGVQSRYIRVDVNSLALTFEYVPGLIEDIPTALAFVPVGKNFDVWIGNSQSIAVDKVNRQFTRIGGILDNEGYGTGLPYNNVSCIVTHDETNDIWIGTSKGAIRYNTKTVEWHYYYGNRWIVGESVKSITIRKHSSNKYSAWIATGTGLSEIVIDANWTLDQKQSYYQSLMYPNHDREGLIESCQLPSYGNLSTCTPGSADNDGLWTSLYVASQCFRYAVTKEPEAKRNAFRSFDAMEKLNKITGIRGLMARSFTKYGQNPAGGVWYNSTVYSGYVWKADTSSDEVTGHLFVYPLVYDLIAETASEKQRAYDLINNITSYIVDNDFTLIDITGKRTHW